MWIREVDFPQALIDAHQAGQLVIFVGAGASMDAPSNLPNFTTLVSDIAAAAHQNLNPQETMQADLALGRLADAGVDVHRQVSIRINTPGSRPNRTHRAIVGLAAVRPPIRLVTTNYDRHLSTLLENEDAALAEYAGPALPMGDEFTGIVYLHGSIAQEPRHLVCTDEDFGRAWLRDAWAARFLERMFAAYPVLFIGYSHSDVVMRYLARSLPRDTPRYVLTDKPDSPDWPRLGVTPIGYPVVDGLHAALPDALAGWASWAAMGMLDHYERARTLLSVPRSSEPTRNDESYLEDLVTRDDTAPLFAKFARGDAWLQWAAARPVFHRLFEPTSEPTPAGVALARWFAEHYVVSNEQCSDSALEVVMRHGGRLGPTVAAEIARHLAQQTGLRSTWLSRWLVLLVRDLPDYQSDWLGIILAKCSWPDDGAAALLLFDHLTTPRPAQDRYLGIAGGSRIDMQWLGKPHDLRRAWNRVFAPNIADAAPDVAAVAAQQLQRAQRLLRCSGAATPGRDPIAYRRSAVGRRSQDRREDAADVVIDAARDSLEALLDARDARGVAHLQAWADSDVPMLRR